MPLRRTHVAVYNNTSKTSLGVQVSEFNQTWESLHRFSGISSVSNFMEIRPMGAAPIDETGVFSA